MGFPAELSWAKLNLIDKWGYKYVQYDSYLNSYLFYNRRKTAVLGYGQMVLIICLFTILQTDPLPCGGTSQMFGTAVAFGGCKPFAVGIQEGDSVGPKFLPTKKLHTLIVITTVYSN